MLSPHRRSALIVEDEILIALDLEATMSALGFEVGLAPSAREARAFAMDNQPDVVVMDVYLVSRWMPRWDRSC